MSFNGAFAMTVSFWNDLGTVGLIPTRIPCKEDMAIKGISKLIAYLGAARVEDFDHVFWVCV